MAAASSETGLVTGALGALAVLLVAAVVYLLVTSGKSSGDGDGSSKKTTLGSVLGGLVDTVVNLFTKKTVTA